MKWAPFTWINLTLCCFKFASFGNLCFVCPVLFESVQNWTTQRFTIMKKLNILKQTVSKNFFYVTGKQLLWRRLIRVSREGGTKVWRSQKRLHHSRWRLSRIWKSFYKVKMDFWEKTNGTFGILDIFAKSEKKIYVFWLYMPWKRGKVNLVKTKSSWRILGYDFEHALDKRVLRRFWELWP